ncbi:hypothetical protein E1266_08245 [Actinomadura sp. 7K534]|nr:hypothetical protein E1266_08245 [Actinomadura sp. 7K534]
MPALPRRRCLGDLERGRPDEAGRHPPGSRLVRDGQDGRRRHRRSPTPRARPRTRSDAPVLLRRSSRNRKSRAGSPSPRSSEAHFSHSTRRSRRGTCLGPPR